MNPRKNGSRPSGNGFHKQAPSPTLFLPDGTVYFETLRSPHRTGRRAQRRSRRPATEADWLALSDGSLADLVRSTVEPSKLQFLHYSNGDFQLLDKINAAGRVFVPPRIDKSLVQGVIFPTQAQECPDIEPLFERLMDRFSRHLPLDADAVFLLTTFVLATWFADVFPIAPQLFVSAPIGADVSSLRYLLQACCRRAIVIDDGSPGTLIRLVNALKPTLILDCLDGVGSLPPGMRRLLKKGCVRGTYSIREGKAYDFYSCRAVLRRYAVDDLSLSAKGVSLVFPFGWHEKPPLTEGEAGEVAKEFLPQLLMLRLQNFRRVSDYCLASELRPGRPRWSVAEALAKPLLGDTKLEPKLLELLAEQEADARMERELEPEWILVQALLHTSHEIGVEKTVGELADAYNLIAAAKGIAGASARRVGSLLKAVGLKTERLGFWGRGIQLNQVARTRIHHLAAQFGITREHFMGSKEAKFGSGGPPCILCKKFGLNTAIDGSLLRFSKTPKRPPRSTSLFPSHAERAYPLCD